MRRGFLKMAWSGKAGWHRGHHHMRDETSSPADRPPWSSLKQSNVNVLGSYNTQSKVTGDRQGQGCCLVCEPNINGAPGIPSKIVKFCPVDVTRQSMPTWSWLPSGQSDDLLLSKPWCVACKVWRGRRADGEGASTHTICT